MDWEPFLPFIPTFFGLLAAFGLQWLGKRYDRRKERQQFLQEIRKELESCSKLLFGEWQLLPTDMWESGKASGWLSLIRHEVKTQFASIYFRIEGHNYEAENVRQVSLLAVTDKEKAKPPDWRYSDTERLWHDLSKMFRESEAELKKDIDGLLRQDIWGNLDS